jgi:hypothetical protein
MPPTVRYVLLRTSKTPRLSGKVTNCKDRLSAGVHVVHDGIWEVPNTRLRKPLSKSRTVELVPVTRSGDEADQKIKSKQMMIRKKTLNSQSSHKIKIEHLYLTYFLIVILLFRITPQHKTYDYEIRYEYPFPCLLGNAWGRDCCWSWTGKSIL